MLPHETLIEGPEQQLRRACAELASRVRGGEACCSEDWLAHFPDLEGDPDAALELVYTEFVVRGELGQGPDPEQFCARFPQWRDRLRRLFDVHRMMCAASRAETVKAAPSSGGARAVVPGMGVPGRRLAAYELLEEVGRGGMGVVYQARDLALGRDVAVKLLQDGYPADSAVARRFVDEARITGQLQHPGIPAVYQVGRLPDGCPFLAMKLIKGRTLDDLLQERPDPTADRGRLLAVFEQLCQAVAYAHSRGVIHRDLKPANVMVGAFGEVQVMDWGLAKVLAAREADPRPGTARETAIRPARDADDATEVGSLLGTPAFMPPEQAIGAVDQLDARSDVFGLGAVLCALLTGQPPYLGADVESTRQLATRAELDDARARLDACGAEPELVALCKRCLAPEQAGRPADAGEVARAVAALRAAAEERARRAELERAAADARAAEQRRRRRAQLALAASVGLLLLGAGAFGWWQDRQAAARRAQLARNADALADLLGRCEGALRADDADGAAAALSEIDRRLPEGGGEAVAGRAEQCRADLALLRALDGIDTSRWTPLDNKLPNPKQLADRWRAALSERGVMPTEGAAERVGRSLVRERLLTALDLWLRAEPSEEVRAVLRTADPDPYRDNVRDALVAEDATRLAALAGQPEALSQPGRFAAALGEPPAVPVERRRAVLHAALRDRPGDLTLLMTLGNSYPLDQQDGAAERVRWFQAAVSAHPGSAAAHTSLGSALDDLGDREGAIAEHQKALAIDPNLAVAHNNCGTALEAARRCREAIDEYRQAIQLEPTYANAHYNLGNARRLLGDVGGAVSAYEDAVRHNPKFSKAHNNLAWILAAGPDGVRDGKRAVEHATRACELTQWKEPLYISALAAAWAEVADFDKAVAYQKRALLSPQLGLNWAGARLLLMGYERKQPYRDPELARPAGKAERP